MQGRCQSIIPSHSHPIRLPHPSHKEFCSTKCRGEEGECSIDVYVQMSATQRRYQYDRATSTVRAGRGAAVCLFEYYVENVRLMGYLVHTYRLALSDSKPHHSIALAKATTMMVCSRRGYHGYRSGVAAKSIKMIAKVVDVRRSPSVTCL